MLRTKVGINWVTPFTWGWVDGRAEADQLDRNPSEFNKIVPNLGLTSKYKELCKQTKKGIPEIMLECAEILRNPLHWMQSSPILFLDHPHPLPLIILVAATEGIFTEGVNFQRITNSKRILDSWFRFEIFWMNFSRKNAIGIGKMSLGRRFYKVQAGSKLKRRGLLRSETFYMWSCSLGLDFGSLHVYLSLASALLFHLSAALLVKL